MRTDQAIANVAVRGAGSRLRVYWPMRQNNATYGIDKFGASDQSGFGFGGGGTGNSEALYNGALAIRMQSSSTPDGNWVQWNQISPFVERTGGAVIDEGACVSLRVTVAYGGIAGGPVPLTFDTGLYVSDFLQNGKPFNTASAGIEFGVIDTASVSLRSWANNGGGAPQVNEVVAAGLTPDVTLYNTYELQFISGSATSDPVMFGLINGVKVTNEYALTSAAGLVPRPNNNSGNPGYVVGFTNYSNGILQSAYVHEFCITIAATQADLY